MNSGGIYQETLLALYLSEGKMGDRNIFKFDVELPRPLE
jgi:hypothetical protein